PQIAEQRAEQQQEVGVARLPEADSRQGRGDDRSAGNRVGVDAAGHAPADCEMGRGTEDVGNWAARVGLIRWHGLPCRLGFVTAMQSGYDDSTVPIGCSTRPYCSEFAWA